MVPRRKVSRKRKRVPKEKKQRKRRKISKPKVIDLTNVDSDSDSEDEIQIIENPKILEKEVSKEVKDNLEDCPICYDKIKDKVKLDCCDHQFCFKCIRKWSVSANSCPICRRKINEIVSVHKNKKKKKRKRVIPVQDREFQPDSIPGLFFRGRGQVVIFYNNHRSSRPNFDRERPHRLLFDIDSESESESESDDDDDGLIIEGDRRWRRTRSRRGPPRNARPPEVIDLTNDDD